MDTESEMKFWKDAGHVARRSLEAAKEKIVAGNSWNDAILYAEKYIERHGGKPAFPTTISVNQIAAHYTTEHTLTPPENWEDEMVFKKGDLVKLDIGAHINGYIADNAMTIEVGNGGKHTEQIKAARDARDASIEVMMPGTPWYKVGAAAEQVAIDAGFRPIRNLCGHQMIRNNLHSGVSVPSFKCGENHPGFQGKVEQNAIYAVEPFNTTGNSGMIENISPRNSSNIYRVTGNVDVRKALAKNKLKPLGAQLARFIQDRYGTLPFAERWAFPMLTKPFPNESEESKLSKWNALVKKLINIRFLETYHALSCVDGGNIGQFEHTVHITESGPEVLTVE
mgnify:FL=1